MLAIGTSLPMVLGFFFVRPIPLPYSEYSHVSDHTISGEDRDLSTESPGSFMHDDSRTRLLESEDEPEAFQDEEVMDATFERRHSEIASDFLASTEDAVAMSPSRSTGGRHRSRSSVAASRRLQNSARGVDVLPNVSGRGLALSRMFWLLFSITALRKWHHNTIASWLSTH